MMSPFNTIKLTKDPQALTEEDLEKIINRLREKVNGAKKGPTKLGGEQLDLDRAEAMLESLKKTGSVGIKSSWNKSNTTSETNTTSKAVKQVSKEVTSEGIEDVAEDTTKAMKNIKFGRTAAILGITAIGVAGIADMAMNAEERHRARIQQNVEKQNQKRKDKRSDKYKYAGTEYQPEAFNDIVQQMFNQRSGHYKMGNSKFN